MADTKISNLVAATNLAGNDVIPIVNETQTKKVTLDSLLSFANSNIKALTGNWDSTFTTVNSNSANWNYQGTDIKALTGNWENTYTTVQSNSANWNYQGTDIKALTGNWQNTYSQFSTNSGSYATTNFVQNNFLPLSGGAITGGFNIGTGSISLYVSENKVGVNTETPNEALTVVGNISSTGNIYGSNINSSNWDSTFTTVNSNSANWNYQGTDIKALTGNWENTYTTVQSNSANWNYQGTDIKALTGNWQNTYSQFSTNSGSYATTNFVQNNFLALTGGNITGTIEFGSGSISLYVNENKVGVNTETPNEALTVVGNISSTGNIYGNASDLINLNASNISSGNLKASILPSFNGDITTTTNNDSVSATVVKIQGNTISSQSPSIGQILQWSGTAWTPGSIANGGSGGGGRMYYLNYGTAPDSPISNLPVNTYELGRSSSSSASAITFNNVSEVSWDTLATFITDHLDPDITTIQAGIWDLNFWASSTATIQTQMTIRYQVYTYNETLSSTTLLATSDTLNVYDPLVVAQYDMSCVVPQTDIDINARVYIVLQAQATSNNKNVTIYYNATRPTHLHTTIPSVGGSGLVKVINGVYQSSASLLVDSDVASNAAIQQSKIDGLTDVSSKANSTFTTVNSNSANWNYQGTDIKALTGNWENTYSQFSNNSGSYVTTDFVQTNFLPLTGGNITGTIEFGSGSTSLYIGNGKIGVNTETPNEALTVVGNISSTGNIYGSNINSSNWDSTFTTVNSNSANWNYQGTDIKALTGNWENTYSQFSNNSGSYVTTNFVQNNFLPLSGGILTNNLTINSQPSGNGVFSTGNLLIGQNEGGAYVGKVGVKENHLSLVDSTIGNTWVAKNSSNAWRNIAMSSDGKIQTAVAEGAQINISLDYGKTWTSKDSSRQWTSSAMSSDGKIQTAIGAYESIYVSYDYGNTWTAKNYIDDWFDISMSADGKIQAVVSKQAGKVYVSLDYGNTWSLKLSGQDFRGIAMSSDGKIQTATPVGGQIYVSSDYGNTWTAKNSSRAWWHIAMSCNGKIQIAPVINGQIYVSYDYGNTWTAKASNNGWTSIAISSDGKIQTASIDNGRIYVSLDYGNTWTAKESNRRWFDVAMSSDGKIQVSVEYFGPIYVSYADSYLNGGLTLTDDINTSGKIYVNGASVTPIVVTNTNTSTLALSDSSAIKRLDTTAGDFSIIIPLNSIVPFNIGTQLVLANMATNIATISATSGVTLISKGNKYKLSSQGSVASLFKTASDEWLLVGDLTS